jgi:hypothetical protein
VIDDTIYILQKTGYTCQLIALCNALRYYGHPSPDLHDGDFELLMDIGHCRHGGATNFEGMVGSLFLEATQFPVESIDKNIPAVVTVENPEGNGGSLHAILIIGSTESTVTAVNYRWSSGPVIEKIPKSLLGQFKCTKIGHKIILKTNVLSG